MVTGGAGSIGVHVISHIMHKTDWNVVNLDSFRHKGYRERLERMYVHYPEWRARVRDIQHDLVCPISPKMQEFIGPVEYIFHLAALSDVPFSVENPVYTIKNNVESTLMILEYARVIKPEVFLYFSTDEVYGPVENGQSHKEWDTHRPSNAYSASKAASEDICHAYWRAYDLPLIITNTENNFGEMQSASKFPVIIQKKVENGEVVTVYGNDKESGTRFYIHSRNVADALLHILKQGVKRHEIGTIDEPLRYHIVGKACLSNLELAQTIARLMGKELKYEMVDFHRDNPGHDIHYALQDNTLRATGWKEPVDFETSMAKVIKWQEENPEWINQ